MYKIYNVLDGVIEKNKEERDYREYMESVFLNRVVKSFYREGDIWIKIMELKSDMWVFKGRVLLLEEIVSLWEYVWFV